MKKLKGYLAPVIVFALLLSSFVIFPSAKSDVYHMKHFNSYEEMKHFIQTHYGMPFYRMEIDYAAEKYASGVDFSKTNVQAEGVDEPDIVKTDGNFIYFLSENVIYIINVSMNASGRIISSIKLDKGEGRNIFVGKNKLIVFCGLYREEGNYSYIPSTLIKIYDVGDPSNPLPWKEVEIDGNYIDARMIDRHIYAISTESIYHILPAGENNTFCPPAVRVGNETEQIPPSSIYYSDMPYPMDEVTNVISINLDNGKINKKSFITGNTVSIYVSRKNIFLACERYDAIIFNEYPDSRTATLIYRISFDNGNIWQKASGEVPGGILNQFSMDEYNGFLRVATTVGSAWAGNSWSGIYVLNMKMERVGSIEKIAPGEEIYAARFMGDKAYLVTFKKVDPLFTINLSNPYNPRIMGKLKIPGYSEYLHPYDKGHLIGIGKETVEAEGKNFAWYQGIKIALFNITDFQNPIEMDRVIIGDRGTDSEALHDHHAFLFSRDKELLVLPVNLHIIDNGTKKMDYVPIYGKFVFQGVYVYRINLRDGIIFRGRITHMENGSLDYSFFIKRAIYIGDMLYTFSSKMVKINSIENLEEKGRISLI